MPISIAPRHLVAGVLVLGLTLSACSSNPQEAADSAASDALPEQTLAEDAQTDAQTGADGSIAEASIPEGSDTDPDPTSETQEPITAAPDGGTILSGVTATVVNDYSADGAPPASSTPISVTAGGGVEIESDSGLPYLIDLDGDSIVMIWDATNATIDDREGAVSATTTDSYTFSFGSPVLSGRTVTAEADAPLVPQVEVVDDQTLIVTIGAGLTIGDGKDAVITLT